MQENEALSLFKCLADRSRLRIVRTLDREDMYGELLAERLDITPATVSFHLRKMEEAGVVSSRREQYYTMYSLNRELLRPGVLDMLREDSPEDSLQKQRGDAYRNKVLRAFFENGRLKAIPAQRKKCVICLEEIAGAFAVGQSYEEKELNEIIRRVYEDYCAIRREMIAEGILSREGSVYTRLK